MSNTKANRLFPFRIDRGGQKASQREPLRFEAEQTLPWSAEDVSWIGEAGDRLGIATRLEEHSVDEATDAEAPTSEVLDALAWLLTKPELAEAKSIAIVSGDDINLFSISNGQLESWLWFPRSQSIAVTLDLKLSLMSMDSPIHILDRGDVAASGNWPVEVVPLRFSESIPELASKGRQLIIRGDIHPIVEFSRDGRASSTFFANSMRHLVWAMIGIVFAGSVFLWLRAEQILVKAGQLRGETEQVYRTVVPNGPRTALVQRAMQSELSNARQEVEALQIANSTRQIRRLLFNFLSAFPSDESVEIDSIDLYPERIELAGRVDQIASLVGFKAKMRQAGFEIDNDDVRKQFQLVLFDSDSEGPE